MVVFVDLVLGFLFVFFNLSLCLVVCVVCFVFAAFFVSTTEGISW